jgi:hypothetical protein
MIPDLRQSPQHLDSLWLCAADLDQGVEGWTPFLDEDREPAVFVLRSIFCYEDLII